MYAALLVILILTLDFITKYVAVITLFDPQPLAFGPFQLTLVKNLGMVLNIGRELPFGALSITSSIFASVFLISAISTQIFLPKMFKLLPFGFLMLAAGFMANATDRALNGFVHDFIGIKMFGIQTPFFNLADVAQVVGYMIVVYSIVFIWKSVSKRERRAHLLVNRKYQLRFCLYLQTAMTIGFIPMFLSGLITYGPSGHAWNFGGNGVNPLLILFAVTSLGAYLSLSVVCWLCGIAISHRTAGALLKFSASLQAVLDEPAKDHPALKLRKGDDFVGELESLHENIRRKIKS